ncbi:MAG: glycosyltransferase [Verrucomicrobiota bacterium]
MKGDAFIDVAERWIAGSCDGLVGTSQPVLDRLRSFEPRKPALLLENGVELEAFRGPVPAPAEYRAIPSPRAVYVGTLDDRFDFKVIARCAENLPAWQLILIGPENSDGVKSLRRLPNVHLLGPKSYLSLAPYLQHADVGLIPLSAHPANRGRSPMKFYEYAAAGIPIIATHTPELARRKLACLTLCQTAEDFIAAFNTFLGPPGSRESIRSAAAPHSWRSKAEQLIAFAESISPDERATSDFIETTFPHD